MKTGSLVVLFLSFCFFSCQNDSTKSESELPADAKIINVQIEQKNRNKFGFSKDEEGKHEWHFTGEQNSRIDLEKLSKVLNALKNLSIVDRFSLSDKSLSDYGLEDSELSIKIAYDTGKSLTLKFGDYNDYANKRYINLEGSNEIGLVSEDFFNLISHQKSFYKNRKVFSSAIEDVCRLEIVSANTQLIFSKDGSEWLVQKGDRKYSADQQAISSLLITLAMFRCEKDLDSSNEKQFDLKVVLNKCSGNENLVEFSDFRNDAFDVKGEPIAFRINRDPGQICSIEKKDAPVISLAINNFRNKYPLKFENDEYTALHMFGKLVGPLRVVEKTEQDYFVNGQKGDGPFIANLFKEFTNLTPESYVSFDEVPVAEPQLQIEGITRGDNKMKVKFWAQKDSDMYLLRESKYKEYFLISKETLAKLVPSLETLLPVEDNL